MRIEAGPQWWLSRSHETIMPQDVDDRSHSPVDDFSFPVGADQSVDPDAAVMQSWRERPLQEEIETSCHGTITGKIQESRQIVSGGATSGPAAPSHRKPSSGWLCAAMARRCEPLPRRGR